MSTFILNITNICNQKCIFCLDGDLKKNILNLSTEEVKEKIEEAKKENFTEVIFMGGETAIRKDFPELIHFCKILKLKPLVATNGTVFADKEYLQKVITNGLNGIEFSFYSYLQDVANKLTGVNTTWKKQVQALKNIREINNNLKKREKLNLIFNITVTAFNYRSLKSTIKFLYKLFNENLFASIKFKATRPIGRAAENKDTVPHFSEVTPFLLSALEYAKEEKIKYSIEMFPLCCIPDNEDCVLETKNIVLNTKYGGWNFHGGFHKGLCNNENYLKASKCTCCSLTKICAGIWKEYLYLFGDSEICPQTKNPSTIINKILLQSQAKGKYSVNHVRNTECEDNFSQKSKERKVSLKVPHCSNLLVQTCSLNLNVSVQSRTIEPAENCSCYHAPRGNICENSTDNKLKTVDASLLQNPALENLVKNITKYIPIKTIIHDKWKLEKIQPHYRDSRIILTLTITELKNNKQYTFYIGPADKNQNCFLYTNSFNLYYYAVSPTCESTTALQIFTNLLLKTPKLPSLIETYNKKYKSIAPFQTSNNPKNTKQKVYELWINTPCDFNCIFCVIKETRKIKKLDAEQLHQFKRNIDKAKKRGATELELNGLEILNYKHILNIVQYAKSIGYKNLNAVTTGIKFHNKNFTKNFTGIFNNNATYHLPLYGHTSQLHDSITQRKGSFDKLVKGIHNILDKCAAKNIFISAIVMKQNYNHIGAIKDFVNNLGINNFSCCYLFPSSDSEKDKYRSCVVNFTAALPFIMCCFPAINFFYPCIIFNYIKTYKISQLSNADNFLYGLSFFLNNGCGNNNIFAFNSESKASTVVCTHINKCVLSQYCSKKIFKKYIQMFGEGEFCCVTEEMLTNLKAKLKLDYGITL